MTLEKLEKFLEFQTLLVFRKRKDLIKEKHQYLSFNHQFGGIYYE